MKPNTTYINSLVVIVGFVFSSLPLLCQDFVWKQSYAGDAGYFSAEFLAPASDGDFLVAGLNGVGGTHISKVSPSGDIRWSYTVGDEKILTVPLNCFETSSGSYRLVSLKNISVGIGGGMPKAPYVLDVNEQGDSTFGNFDPQSGSIVQGSRAVQISDDGIKVVSIRFGSNPPMFAVGSLDNNANLKEFVDFLPVDQDSMQTFWATAELSDGGLAVAGQIELPGGATQFLTLTKVDADGSLVWDKRFAPGKRNWMRTMSQTSNGDLLVVSNVVTDENDLIQISLMRLDEDGEIIWQKNYSLRELDRVQNVFETSAGTLVVLGGSGMYNDGRTALSEGSMNAFVLHLDADGTLLWKTEFGEDGANESTMTLLELNNGNFLIGGISNGDDMFLAELDIFTLTGVEDEPEEGRALSVVCPHPVSGQAVVEFQLAKAGNAEMRLYDAAGRQIAMQQLGYLAAGEQQVELQVAELSAGCYYYQVKVDLVEFLGSFVKQ